MKAICQKIKARQYWQLEEILYHFSGAHGLLITLGFGHVVKMIDAVRNEKAVEKKTKVF